MAKSTSPFFDTATTLGKIVAFLGISALCGVLAAGLMMPMAAMGGALADSGQEVFDQLPAELKEEPLSVPSRILAEDGTVLATFYAENRVPVELDQISQNMKDAIVSIEDERFYEHSGVDARGLARALVNNATSDSQQGASTLTQQYVNNVLVNYQSLNNERTTISGTKTPADKLREMKLAVAVEKEMSKDQILEGYLNIVLFSGRVYGVEAASRYFFNKNAADLTVPEAAMLAGMVQSPNGYNPVTNPEGAEGRRNVVLASMLKNEKITQAEYEEYKAVPVESMLDVTPQGSGCFAAELGAYFCDYVQLEILDDEAFGPDREARQRLLDRGGLTIQTTLNAEMQRAAEEEVSSRVPHDSFDGAGGAMVSVEPGTGNIKAMAQNTVYSPEAGDGNTTLNFNTDFNRGGSRGFQAGSTMKPYVSLAWVEAGHSMIDTIDAANDYYPQWTEFEASCQEGGAFHLPDEDGWAVNNAIANMKKPMRVDYGLYWSINTATAAEFYLMDMCEVGNLTERMGVHRADNGDPINATRPSFILGAEEVSPLTMAASYATLADDGTYCKPRALVSVTDTRGNEYQVPPVDCTKAVDTQVVAEVNHTLEAIAGERTARGELPFPVAGKTGTNNNSSSTWFVGYSTGLSTASWVGNYKTTVEGLAGKTIGGVYFEDVWGSIIAGPMWVDFMKVAGPLAERNEFTEYTGPVSDPVRTDGRHPEGEVVDADAGRGGPLPERRLDDDPSTYGGATNDTATGSEG